MYLWCRYKYSAFLNAFQVAAQEVTIRVIIAQCTWTIFYNGRKFVLHGNVTPTAIAIGGVGHGHRMKARTGHNCTDNIGDLHCEYTPGLTVRALEDHVWCDLCFTIGIQ